MQVVTEEEELLSDLEFLKKRLNEWRQGREGKRVAMASREEDKEIDQRDNTETKQSISSAGKEVEAAWLGPSRSSHSCRHTTRFPSRSNSIEKDIHSKGVKDTL
jgi:hypothetical protein